MFYAIFFGAFFIVIMGIVRTAKATRNTEKRISTVMENQLNRFSTNTVKKEAEKNSHAAQMSYSQYYSEKPIKDSGVHDGPLSEAERNVIYGK